MYPVFRLSAATTARLSTAPALAHNKPETQITNKNSDQNTDQIN